MNRFYFSGIALSVFLTFSTAYSQPIPVAPSLESLNERLTKNEEAAKAIDELNKRYATLSQLLSDNNDALKKFTKEDIFTYQTKLDGQIHQIVYTAACTQAAHRSLTALSAAASFSNYLTSVVNLNSPSNNELGISLSDEIISILNTRIFKNPDRKVNGSKPSKVLDIVKNVIDNPIVTTVASAFPVVNSIRSVVDLIAGVATRGDDVSVSDLTAIKVDLRKFLDYYQGLSDANVAFSSKLESVMTRLQALNLILDNSILERLKVLDPTLEIASNRPILELVNNEYNGVRVKYKLDLIYLKYQAPSGHKNRENLEDPRLFLADGTISQVRFIKDEIETIDKTYWSAYDSYQADIERVLESAIKNGIGDKVEIGKKINTLRNQLADAKVKQAANVNLNALQGAYEQLARGRAVELK
jgi:hypothetical protein